MFHQAGAVIGQWSRPSVPGIRAAFAQYGFDTVDIHIGLGIPRRTDRDKLASADVDNRAYAAQIAADGGHVLLGELHAKEIKEGRSITHVPVEKQVDVACAVDLCRLAADRWHRARGPQYDAVIVCSEDSDLHPAFDYARRVNCPFYVAGHSKVHVRGYPYIMLTERAYRLATACTPPAGHELRRLVARAALERHASTWTVGDTTRARDGYLANRADGARGIIKPKYAKQLTTGSTIELHPLGIDFGERRADTPLVRLGPRKLPENRRHTLIERTVTRRFGLFHIGLDHPVANGVDRLHYPPGGVQPGSIVLVDCTHEPIVVGPTSALPMADIAEAAPVLVEVKARVSDTTTRVQLEGRSAMLVHSRTAQLEPWSVHAAVMQDRRSRPTLHLLSSRLPGQVMPV